MAETITFVSGAHDKNQQFTRYLNVPGLSILHLEASLPEIQSLDPIEVARHKALEAYRLYKRPLLVDDASLVFSGFGKGKLPGPFIKHFLQDLGPEGLCRILDGSEDRSAVATATLALYDGTDILVFGASMPGTIAHNPQGIYGHGWDSIFIPTGFNTTRAQMPNDSPDRDKTSVRKRALDKLGAYLLQQYSSHL